MLAVDSQELCIRTHWLAITVPVGLSSHSKPHGSDGCCQRKSSDQRTSWLRFSVVPSVSDKHHSKAKVKVAWTARARISQCVAKLAEYGTKTLTVWH
jgi:hypothetical protein